MEKKYQIFISSTYKDLIEARAKVRDAILSMMHFPVGMEMFNAADEEQWEIIQETIDSSDYYVLILGQRYGSTIEEGPDAGISYTEKEFRYAREKQIPILVFIISDKVKLDKECWEPDPEKMRKLEAFKEAAKEKRTVQWWSNPDELAHEVSESLHKQFDRKKRVGWIRGDSFDIEKSHAELLELSKKVRELETENARLKSQVVERGPCLSVSFLLDEEMEEGFEYDVENECRSHGKLLLENSSDRLVIRMECDNAENYQNRYEPLSTNDIAPYLKKYITEDDIEKYNHELPEKTVTDEYVRAMKKYDAVKNSGLALILKIANKGTAKATDVRVKVTVSEEILCMKVRDVEKWEEPEAPDLPVNPIKRAEAEYARKLDPLSWLDNYNYTVPKQVPWPERFDLRDIVSLSDTLEASRKTFSIKENEMTANCTQIPHKAAELYKGCYLVPLERGKYQIQIKMMCSEYIEPEVQYIDVEVV